MPDKLYRYYDIQYSAGVDEWGNNLGAGQVGLGLMEFDIIKETKCGCWIMIGYWLGGPGEIPQKDCLKFVNMKAHKQYACRTKEAALTSFQARKKRQITILTAQIKRAKEALQVASNMIGGQ